MRVSVVLCLVLFSWVARAAESLAIVNLPIALADTERAQVQATIEGAVRRASFELLPDLQVKYLRTSAPELFNCFVEDRCRADLSHRLSADYLLTGRIDKEGDAYVMQ